MLTIWKQVKKRNCFVTRQVVSLLPDGQRRALLKIITVVLLVGEMCTSNRKKD